MCYHNLHLFLTLHDVCIVVSKSCECTKYLDQLWSKHFMCCFCSHFYYIKENAWYLISIYLLPIVPESLLKCLSLFLLTVVVTHVHLIFSIRGRLVRLAHGAHFLVVPESKLFPHLYIERVFIELIIFSVNWENKWFYLR